MFKRPRLVPSLLLCFSLSFVACNKDDDEKKDDETSEDEDDASGTGDGDKKTTKEDDETTSDGKDETTKDDTTKDDTNADPLVAARKLFEKECAGCHGDNGEKEAGRKSEKFDSDKAKDWKDDYITGVIEDGKGTGMPKFSDKLSSDEIKSLIALIRCFQEKSDPADCGK